MVSGVATLLKPGIEESALFYHHVDFFKTNTKLTIYSIYYHVILKTCSFLKTTKLMVTRYYPLTVSQGDPEQRSIRVRDLFCMSFYRSKNDSKTDMFSERTFDSVTHANYCVCVCVKWTPLRHVGQWGDISYTEASGHVSID